MLKIVEDSLRNRYKIIIILLCLIALTGLMYIDSIEHMENYDPTVAYQVGDEIIDTYVVGDKHYLFLPSWGIVNGGVDTEDIIVMKSENLPSMHIWTDSGSIDKIWNDKEAFETGRMLSLIHISEPTRPY